jgi:hypothetical protein
MGRPEIKNIVLRTSTFDPVNRDLEIRDLYNAEDTFDLSRDYLGAYRARLNANLAFFDRLDGRTDWPLDDQGGHPLTELLLADFLVVDTSKPFAEGSFLEIERGHVCRPAAHHLRRPPADRRHHRHPSTRCWWAASTARGSATASTSRPSRPPAAFRTWLRPTRIRRTRRPPSLPCRHRRSSQHH